MLNLLVVSEDNFGKNLIAGAYLRALGGEYFTVACAGFEPGPLNSAGCDNYETGWL